MLVGARWRSVRLQETHDEVGQNDGLGQRFGDDGRINGTLSVYRQRRMVWLRRMNHRLHRPQEQWHCDGPATITFLDYPSLYWPGELVVSEQTCCKSLSPPIGNIQTRFILTLEMSHTIFTFSLRPDRASISNSLSLKQASLGRSKQLTLQF